MTKREESLEKQETLYRQELERISGLTAQEAKDLIIKNLENEAKHDAQGLINKIEQANIKINSLFMFKFNNIFNIFITPYIHN